MPVDFPPLRAPDAKPQAASGGGSGPAALYRERAAAGIIRADPAQQRVAARLQQLHKALWSDRPASRRRLLARLGRAERLRAMPTGLYLWGPVGRGKSMLMDLFFDAAPVAAKRRVHFHAFMLEAHDRIERER